MKKARRVITIMLGCVMLLEGTLSANASTYPYNKACVYCGGPNTGVLMEIYSCTYWNTAPHDAALYKCGRCEHVFYYCSIHGTHI